MRGNAAGCLLVIAGFLVIAIILVLIAYSGNTYQGGIPQKEIYRPHG